MAFGASRSRAKVGVKSLRTGFFALMCKYSPAIVITILTVLLLMMIAVAQLSGSPAAVASRKARTRTLIRAPAVSQGSQDRKAERLRLYLAMGYIRSSVLEPSQLVTSTGSGTREVGSVAQGISCIVDESQRNLKMLHEAIARGPVLHVASPCALDLAMNTKLLDVVQELIGPKFSILEAQLVTPSMQGAPQRAMDSGCAEDESVQVWIGLRTTADTPLVLLPGADVQEESTTGPEEAIGVELDAGGAVFIRNTMMHEWPAHSDGSSLLALKLVYAKPTCRYRVKDPETGLPSTALPPVVLARGKFSEEELEQNNVMIVRTDNDGNKRAQHRYNLYDRRKAPMTWQEADAEEKQTAIEGLFTDTFPRTNTVPELIPFTKPANPVKNTAVKGIPHTSTKRLAYLASHWTHQMMYKPVHTPHRHLREEFIVLLSGQVRVTFLTADGTIPRETIMSNVGDTMAIDRLAWHSITALNTKGALYLCFDVISQADLQQQILPNRKNVLALYDSKVEKAKHGIVQFPPRDGNSGVHPFFTRRSLRTHFVVVEPGMSDIPDGFADCDTDRLIICLKGTLEFFHTGGKTQVHTYEHILFYAGVRVQLENTGDTTAEYIAVDAAGIAYDGLVLDETGKPVILDPGSLSPAVRKQLAGGRNLRKTK